VQVAVGRDLDAVFMAMEFMEHDLKGLLDEMKRPFSQAEAKTLMLQLLEGTAYLHDHWVLHRCGRHPSERTAKIPSTDLSTLQRHLPRGQPPRASQPTVLYPRSEMGLCTLPIRLHHDRLAAHHW
jgi:serine/threonine protein kinase